jgi:stress response protein YsnF
LEDELLKSHVTPGGEELVLPLYAEDVSVSRRRVATTVVRVATVTRSRNEIVDETLTHQRVEVERVPIGRYVDAVPAVREEGDLTVMAVVEEVIVVERKLLLREEVHIRRIRSTEQHVETVKLREQEAVVTRTPATERDIPTASSTPVQETE